jgi:hypothetical protein
VVGEENTAAAVQARSPILCQYFFARFTKPVVYNCLRVQADTHLDRAGDRAFEGHHRQPPPSRGRILLTSPMVSKLSPRWQPRSPLGRRLDIPGTLPVLGTILLRAPIPLGPRLNPSARGVAAIKALLADLGVVTED